jgi:CubicO group peptidase (beta-lactamase class C family)
MWIMDRRLFLTGLAGHIPAVAFATPDDELEALVAAQMQVANLPGLALAHIDGGRVSLIKTYGFADLASQTPVTPDTAFHIASLSKIFTGTIIMQLIERGRIRLNDPIDKWLDFAVRNPKFPDTPITFGHLLSHAASIADKGYGEDLQSVGDSPIDLRDFLISYLTPAGTRYKPETSFTDAAPGQRFAYCNVAYALLGYLAARVGKEPLEAQTDKRIFKPLKMTHSAWTLKALGTRPRTTPYVLKDGAPSPIAPPGYPDWPAGLMRTSITDLATFVATFGRDYQGPRLLKPETTALMSQPIPLEGLPRGAWKTQGLVWSTQALGGVDYLMHGGADPGASAVAAFTPDRAKGIVLVTNMEPSKAVFGAFGVLAKAVLTP